jgi:uncharacterized protein (TIGR00288 family)
MPDVSSLAVFVDFENLALGFQNRHSRFDIRRVLQRLVEKGKIIVKKGYADWSRYADYKRQLHESGLELIEIPRRAMTGKNSADIRLCVDAMDLCYSKEHIDTFVIVSGDSDFSPLVAKLKENGKRVLGLAMRKSTSELLVNSCDEFIFYEDLEAAETPASLPGLTAVPAEKQDAFRLLLDTLVALRRETTGTLYSSMIKDTIKRKQPSFVESTYGYRTFSELLEEAQTAGLLKLSTDPRSGTYVVTDFNAPGRKRTRRGGRGRRGRGRVGAGPEPAAAARQQIGVPGGEPAGAALADAEMEPELEFVAEPSPEPVREPARALVQPEPAPEIASQVAAPPSGAETAGKRPRRRAPIRGARKRVARSVGKA